MLLRAPSCTEPLNAPPNHPAIKKSTSDRTDLTGLGSSVDNIRAARLASLGLACNPRFRDPVGVERLLMWWRSRFALVAVAWLVFVPSALGFEQVPGSPFATNDPPIGIAFSAGGGLLATANYSGVSVFSVDRRSGALSRVPGSPFGGVGRGNAVAFSPDGRLLAETGGYPDPAMGVFSVNASTGALSPVAGSPFLLSQSGGVAFSPDGRLLATTIGGVGVFSVDPVRGR